MKYDFELKQKTILVTGGTPGIEGTTSYLQLITVK